MLGFVEAFTGRLAPKGLAVRAGRAPEIPRAEVDLGARVEEARFALTSLLDFKGDFPLIRLMLFTRPRALEARLVLALTPVRLRAEVLDFALAVVRALAPVRLADLALTREAFFARPALIFPTRRPPRADLAEVLPRARPLVFCFRFIAELLWLRLIPESLRRRKQDAYR